MVDSLFSDSSLINNNDELNVSDRETDANLFVNSSYLKSSLKEQFTPPETTFLKEADSKLVFVDTAVKDYQNLLKGVEKAEVIDLNADRDGIRQITEALNKRKNVSSIEIISHGSAGTLDLGATRLAEDTLGANADALRSWSKALTPDADILLYGCNFAENEAGKALQEQIAELTGADIAASNDPTGNTGGGDWELESKTGSIESVSALSDRSKQAYNNLLIRVEAESMTRQNYRLEANSTASGGQLISFLGGDFGETGTASFDFAGASGNYDVVVGYYDENDGLARFSVAQNSATVNAWTADRASSSNLADAGSFTTRTLAIGRAVNTGDRFTITGTEEQREPARVDYIEFIPTPVVTATSRLALETNAYRFGEGAGNATVNVVRSSEIDQAVSVDYETFDNTATAGEDYTATEGTLFFAPGETRKSVSVPILEDTRTEGNQAFSFVIDNISENGTLGAPRTARITITDNETPPPLISLTETNGNTQVTEAGETDSYSLVLTKQPTTNVNVSIAPDGQLKTNTQRLRFTPSNWNQPRTITISAIDDLAEEGIQNATIRHTVNSSDRAFNNFKLEDVDVTISDNDIGSFVIETFASGLNTPTAFDWTPDGEKMFVAQKDGVVRVVDDGDLNPTPFIDISQQVNNVADRGLIGIAVNPNFETNPYVYLSFTYDPPEVYQNTGLAGPDREGNRPSRLIRVTADASTDYTTAVPGSEVVLLGTNSTFANTSRPDGNSTDDLTIPPSGITPTGENIRDYLATDSQSHSIGGVNFGNDGSLFVSNGDGTSYNDVDPRAVRVQDLDNLSGKLLRIDPLTGKGLASNPFYNGDPDSNRSKVYSYGFRNPFRFSINPFTGEPVVGDVGWTDWEEINSGRGANFGWPFYEGGSRTNLRRRGYEELPEAQAFYASGQPVQTSIYALDHAEGAEAIAMGEVYQGNTFPEIYRGGTFFADYGEGTVRYFKTTGTGIQVNTFVTGVPGIVQISDGPNDDNLYFADILTGQISRWRYDEDIVSQSVTREYLDRRDDLITSPRKSFSFA
jgi:glucose/arabinose dehydrogenase